MEKEKFPVQYLELKEAPIDPNKVRKYAFVLSLVALLIAVVTVRSNYDYFAQYYGGWSFWMRLIPFLAVEATIIALPLAGGWGNRAQWQAAKVCELLLIALALVHTSLVSQSDQARIQATKTKAEAQVDLEREQKQIDKILEQNQRLSDSHSLAMMRWNRAAATARRMGQAAPPAPPAPQMAVVPQLDQRLVSDATLSTHGASEATVNHRILLRLLWAMIGMVAISSTLMFTLADASKIRAWLLRRKAQAIDAGVRAPGQAAELQVVEAIGGALVSEPRRIMGFRSDQTGKAGATAQTCLDTDAVSAIRQRLIAVSGRNPGLSFKVDARGPKIYVRAMKAGQGRQLTAATVKLTEDEAQQLAIRSEWDCQRDLVDRFRAHNILLNH